MPLIAAEVKLTGLPLRVIAPMTPAAVWLGSMACSPTAPPSCVTVKLRELPSHASAPNVELFRPSSHFNIWTLDTSGTPRASADESTASATGEEVRSVCALTVYAP